MKRKLLLIIAGAIIGIFVLQFPARGAEPAKTQNEAGDNLDKSLKKVMPAFENKPVPEVIYINAPALAQKCDFEKDKGCKVYPGKRKGALIGFAIAWTSMEGFKGPITVLLGLTPEGKITGIDVIKQEETKNLGFKITEEEFQKQFQNKDLKGAKWAIDKDGGDIKSVTGASYSSRAVAGAVKETLEFFDKNKAALVDKAKGK